MTIIVIILIVYILINDYTFIFFVFCLRDIYMTAFVLSCIVGEWKTRGLMIHKQRNMQPKFLSLFCIVALSVFVIMSMVITTLEFYSCFPSGRAESLRQAHIY